MAEELLHVTPAMLDGLVKLRPEFNFKPDAYYTGVHDPSERIASELAFTKLIDTLTRGLPKHSSKSFVLQQFELTLSSLPLGDTEDRERAAIYCEKIMDVLQIESSDGVLNRWLYGPILGDLVKKNP